MPDPRWTNIALERERLIMEEVTAALRYFDRLGRWPILLSKRAVLRLRSFGKRPFNNGE